MDSVIGTQFMSFIGPGLCQLLLTQTRAYKTKKSVFTEFESAYICVFGHPLLKIVWSAI
jgi:hypothetical protein